MTALNHRYDFALFFDVENGNPNGDPDAGNMPRLDPETGHGLVTDVCLKRKVRNFVELTKRETGNYKTGEADKYNIYVREKAILNLEHAKAYAALGIEPPKKKSAKDKSEYGETDAAKKKSAKENSKDVEAAKDWMCRNFYDVRTFGAVMSTGDYKCGQVRGPVQLAFAKSINQVVPRAITVTRMAVATEKEAEEQKGDNRTMGSKFIVPYGLYRVHGFISAPLAERTGFSEDDLNLFWSALKDMFEYDRSAARGEMASRKLFVFRHNDKLGSAHAHKLFDLVTVKKTADGPARVFSDYQIEVDRSGLPDSVELIEML
ncbi:MAG: type I-C CRISPR-associated protein Cas7/Csd2 [Candidatus Adiutrix sp.]|jgi:CRISPR-associated protein Csd2|nr:type I-C CRISPR-associated protein Cas7/Csd2 [Candidatus Adiutrix sp.]